MQDNVHAFLALATRCFDLAGPIHRFGSHLESSAALAGEGWQNDPGRPEVHRRIDTWSNPAGRRSRRRDALTDRAAKTIICVDTFERMFEARRDVQKRARALAPGGIMLIAAPMNLPAAEDTGESWQYTPAFLDQIMAPLSAKIIGTLGPELFPHTVFGIGCQSPLKASFLGDVNVFISKYQAWLESARRSGGWKEKLRRTVAGWMANKAQRERRREQYKVRFVIHVDPDVPMGDASLEAISPSIATGTRLDHLS